MDENNIMVANSGIFHIGADSESLQTFREHYEWLKWYYALRGFRFCDVRQHVLSRYNFCIDQYSFKDLFQWYTHHMQMHYRNELCDTVNDNDYFSYCCVANRVPSDSEAPPRHVYPLVKLHPMSAFMGLKITRFGHFTMRNLADRLAKK